MRIKLPISLTVFVISALFLAGCGNKESWAYIHDPETEILSLSDNGKAEYKGDNYSYTRDDKFLVLKDGNGNETKMRFIPDGDKMVLYESSTYTYDGEGEPDSILGVWTQDNGWLFEFTDKGTFTEENIFYGHYEVNEADHTIKLMYDEPMEDAILYYSLDGNELTIDYPWPMVRTQKK